MNISYRNKKKVESRHVAPFDPLLWWSGVQHLPSLYVVFGTAAGLAVGSSSANIPFIWFGTYIAWFYLRFLQARPEVAGR